MPAGLSPAHATHVTHASHASPPRRRDKRAPLGEGATGAELRCSATQATRARALFGPGPTTLGTVYGPGPGAPVGVLKLGYLSTPNLCTDSSSTLRQGLPGERQEPPRSFLGQTKTKYLSQEDETPARGACRAEETRPRQEELAGTTKPKHQGPGERSSPGRPTKAPQEKLAAAHHAPRQGLASGKLSGAARQPPRQATCRGKSPPQACAPAHLPTRRPGAPPKARGEAPCSLRRAVARNADRIAIVANGGAPNGPLRHCSGDPDGHLMPLSPAVRVRYDSTLQPLFAQPFAIFTLTYVATCG